MSTPEKRSLNPEQIHQLWLAIIATLKRPPEVEEQLTSQKLPPAFIAKQSLYLGLLNADNSSDDKCNNKSITAETFDKTVQIAIKEGLILQSNTLKKEIDSVNNNQDVVNECETNETDLDCSDDQDKHTIIGLPLNEVDNQLVLNKNFKDSLTHDWYCFECHLAGTGLYECESCWRVFHFNCCSIANQVSVKIEPEDPSIDFTTSVHLYKFNSRNFVCPICFLKQKYPSYSIGSRQFSHEEFNKILSYTYTRFKTKSSQISRSLLKLKESLQSSSVSLTSLLTSSVNTTATTSSNAPSVTNISTSTYANELNTLLALQYLSYNSVDLGDIENKLDNSKYETIGEFLGDCLSFEHMLEVATISSIEQQPLKRRIRDTLTRMLDACRYDLKEMLGCVDCYRNSNQISDKYWFCRPCQPPHLLVFAKQMSYSFWPAKVIYPRFAVDIDAYDHFDVRFFGTNHERCHVHKSNIKDINSTMGELNITKILPSLKKALSELRDHRELLEKPDSDCNKQDCELNEDCNNDNNCPDRPNSGPKSLLDSTEDDTNESTATSNSNSNLSNNSKKIRSKKLKRIEEVKNEIGDEIVENGSTEPQETSDSDNENFVDAHESIGNVCNNNDDDNDATKTEEDDTDIDESLINDIGNSDDVDDEQDSKESVQDEIRQKLNCSNDGCAIKRRRGRPKKYLRVTAPVGISKNIKASKKLKNAASSPKARVRRQKIIYSPQSNKYQKLSATISPISPVSKLTLSTRGRKSRLFADLSESISTETSSKSPEPSKRARRIRNSSPNPALKLPISSVRIKLEKSPIKSNNKEKPRKTLTSTSKDTISSRTAKRMSQYQNKKTNLERERLARRKLKLKKEGANISNLSKHIPPVTATKSSPVFAVPNGNSTFPSKAAQIPVSSTSVIAQNVVQPTTTSGYSSNFKIGYPAINGFNTTYPPHSSNINGFTNYAINGISSRSLVPNQPYPFGTQIHQQKLFNLPSSVLKPLSNGDYMTNEDTTDDDVNLSNYHNSVDNETSNTSNSNSNLDRLSTTTSKIYLNNIQQQSAMTNNNVDDDDDEDPYLYDDEQLEEQINDYLAYQEEKEMEVQQLQQFQYHQYYQQQDYARFAPSMPPPNGFVNHQQEFIDSRFNPPVQSPKKSNSLEPQTPIKMYIDYANAPIYSPTKKNQRLVNTYLHHIDHNHFPPQRTDYLAQLMIRKEEFELNAVELHEPINNNNNNIRKRGRPPKDIGDDVMERSGKAKCLVEKTYLQESSCNRLCLTKNMKNFKRFRDFVENQNKTDMEKLKNEVESLKKEVHRLTSKQSELETDLKRERDIVRRCDPAMVTQMEEKHKLAISLIKQKQWCINCEAEAAYFCCFNTNYCSPECQHKHWNTGHKNSCTRNRPNHGKNTSFTATTSNHQTSNNIATSKS